MLLLVFVLGARLGQAEETQRAPHNSAQGTAPGTGAAQVTREAIEANRIHGALLIAGLGAHGPSVGTEHRAVYGENWVEGRACAGARLASGRYLTTPVQVVAAGSGTQPGAGMLAMSVRSSGASYACAWPGHAGLLYPRSGDWRPSHFVEGMIC